MADAIASYVVAAPSARPRMRAWQQAALSLYWFATNAHWTAILITLLPLQAELIGGAEFKGTTLGQILAIGALASMIVAPLFGAWSDRVRTRWGRRKPFVVVGTIGNVLGLLALAFIPSTPSALVPYILAFIWIELFNNLATAPYSGLIPDMVAPEQRGSASGWMGLMLMLGNFLGGVTGLVLGAIGGISGAYIFRWGAFVRGLLEPFKSRDFSWVFWTRFLVTLGTFTVQSFLLFYMKDVIAGGADIFDYTFFGVKLAGDPAGATSFFVLPLLLGAILSSLAAGMLSDRYGRKLMVYISGGLQALVVLIFLLSTSFATAVIMGLVFGLGYGAYQAVDWALASDVLPSESDYAKDMGIWHVSFTLPQVLAVPIGGVLLDTFQRIGRQNDQPNLGYTVLFVLAFVYFLLGTVFVRQIKGAR